MEYLRKQSFIFEFLICNRE